MVCLGQRSRCNVTHDENAVKTGDEQVVMQLPCLLCALFSNVICQRVHEAEVCGLMSANPRTSPTT